MHEIFQTCFPWFCHTLYVISQLGTQVGRQTQIGVAPRPPPSLAALVVVWHARVRVTRCVTRGRRFFPPNRVIPL